jgi:hypothetical protein
MSIAERTMETPFWRAPQITGVGGMTVPYRAHIYFVCVVMALACNYVLGKDMAWDTLNYHLYLGFSAVNNRFDQDYFAAGTLSYLNPYAYAPFYLMVRAGLPALAICSAFAAVHSIILWLVFELGVAVCPSRDGQKRMVSGMCAAVLAFMNPILMQQIGSCFADITTAELALGGWLLLAGAVQFPRASRVIFAGLLLGAASALKLSNALSAIAVLTMLVFLPLSWRGRIKQAVLYGISLATGFLVVAAPWSYRLEKLFGNPMFPMFNNVFQSPEFTTESGTANRFIPDSLGDALWRPFAMVNPEQMVHEELSSPDLRYAILVVLVGLVILRWVWSRYGFASKPTITPPMTGSTRVLAALGFGLSVNWILWLRISGNSRYVLTMACIAAAVVIGMLFRLFDSRPKIRVYILASIFVTQAIQLYMGTEYRWNGVPWGGPWFDLAISEKLKTEPNLYLTLGTQSNSFLAPFLARGSGFVNLVGGYTLDPASANGVRVKAMIHKFSPHVKVIFLTRKPLEGDAPINLVSQLDGALQMFGLRADMHACSTISVHGLPPELQIRFESSTPQEPQQRETTFIGVCGVVLDTSDLSALMARQHAINIVLDRLEDACPQLFKPRRLTTVHSGDAWRRLYGATDLVAWVSYGRVKFSDQIRPNGLIDVGSESDWARAPLRLDCGRQHGKYYASVVPITK